MSLRRKSSSGSNTSWADQRLEAAEKDPLRQNESDWEDEDEFPSSHSSRVTSGSYQPMLGTPSSRSKATTAFSRRPKPFFMSRFSSSTKCLGFVLSSIIILFILSLIRASHSSAREVAAQIELGGIVNKPPEWESFPFLFGYYGGLRSLVDKSANVPEYPGEPGNRTELDGAASKSQRPSHSFDPYPAYTSEEYITQYGEKVDCFLDEAGKIRVPAVHMYEGVPQGMPEAVLGSAELLGMRDDICFDRLGRLGPYGLGYSIARGGSGASMNGDRDGADDVWNEIPEVDWRKVRWNEVQKRCIAANKHRFPATGSSKLEHAQPLRGDAPTKAAVDNPEEVSQAKVGKEKLPRIAVVIRTWYGFDWTPESIIYVRSIISELSLNTGAEYTVHFLIQVKDDDLAIWSDDATYERVMRESLPEEFQGMGTLWTERQMFLVYGGLQETWMRDLPVHGVYRSTFMPVQYFAFQHQEYDHFWQWEMDARYTGHYYHLFDSVSKWAKAQPRKHLWERNSRFYVPTEHGSWEDFRQMVRVQTEAGTNSPNNMWSGLKPAVSANDDNEASSQPRQGERPIWGPEPPLDDDVSWDLDPQPPTSYTEDKYTWGVGEEADLITFNPLFDPDGTSWLLADDVTGYNLTRSLPPRRAAIITASRLSRRLLLTMHHETAIGRHTMFSEMWPASCALHHGFKAVYAPHAEFIDRRWPTSYLASVFNGGRNGASGGARTSVFGDREHNFRGVTWYYNAGFPEVLWHRWLGYRFNNDGGEEWEVSGQGRMCLPAMLLHPVKRVELVQEGRKAED